jgi:hypothetical protein
LCSQFDLATRETFEIGELHQRALEPGRAHLEAKRPGREQVLVDIQTGRHVPTNPRAIFQRHPAPDFQTRDLPVDYNSNYRTLGLSQVAHIHQLHAMGAANGVDQSLQCLDELFSSLAQILLRVAKRKTGGPWRPTQER